MKNSTSYASDREVRNNNRRPYQSMNSHRDNHAGSSGGPGRGSPQPRAQKKYHPNRPRDEQTRPCNPSTPWMLTVLPDGKYASTEQRLHTEIIAYADYCTPTAAEQNARAMVMAGIKRIVDSRFRRAQVHVFGSFATGLSLPSSDIDVAITVPNLPESSIKGSLFQISSRLRNSGIVEQAIVFHRARAPIIAAKTNEAYGSFDIDIGINNPAGMEAIEVIKNYLSTMPTLQPLVLVLKGFLAQRDMNDPSKGGLGSYPLVCMCIFLLKNNPYHRPKASVDEEESLGSLVMDFLRYYGTDFPYKTKYISLSESAELKDKATPSDSLSIRCLIIPENEVSKAVRTAKPLAATFQDAYGSLVQLTPQEINASESVLGQIVTFDGEVIRRRAMIEANFTPRPGRPSHPYQQAAPSLLSRLSVDPRYPPPQNHHPYRQQGLYGGYGQDRRWQPNWEFRHQRNDGPYGHRQQYDDPDYHR